MVLWFAARGCRQCTTMQVVTIALCCAKPVQRSPAVLLTWTYGREWEQALPSVKEQLKVKSAERMGMAIPCCLSLPRCVPFFFCLLWYLAPVPPPPGSLPWLHLGIKNVFVPFSCSTRMCLSVSVFRWTFSLGAHLYFRCSPGPSIPPTVLVMCCNDRLRWITCSFCWNYGLIPPALSQ